MADLIGLEIIIVNWNSGFMLEQCLQSIEAADNAGFKLNSVTIVDNASSDRSFEVLDRFTLPVKIIDNKKNVGFAKACNQGADGSNSEYLLFLNPDTVLERDSLHKPLFFMEKTENSEHGIIGLQMIDSENRVSRSSARFPGAVSLIIRSLGLDKIFPLIFPGYLMKEWDHLNSTSVDHVIGAFYMVRNTLFKKLRGFDERYFLYMEDVDFSLRASKLGYSTYFMADSRIHHRGGGSTSTIKAKRLYYSLSSRMLYALKHFNLVTAALTLIAILFIEFFTRFLFCIITISFDELRETINAYLLLWRNIPNIIFRQCSGEI